MSNMFIVCYPLSGKYMVYGYMKKMKNTDMNAVVPMSEGNHVKIEYVSAKKDILRGVLFLLGRNTGTIEFIQNRAKNI